MQIPYQAKLKHRICVEGDTAPDGNSEIIFIYHKNSKYWDK